MAMQTPNTNNKEVKEDLKKGSLAPAPEGTDTQDNGNDNGNTPEVIEEVVKEGIFTRFGRIVDKGVNFAVNTGKKAWGLAKEHPVIAAGVVAGGVYGGYKIYNAVKGEDTDDDIIDVECIELPEVPEVPQIPQVVQEPVIEIPQIETPVEVIEAVEGPTEGIFD